MPWKNEDGTDWLNSVQVDSFNRAQSGRMTRRISRLWSGKKSPKTPSPEGKTVATPGGGNVTLDEMLIYQPVRFSCFPENLLLSGQIHGGLHQSFCLVLSMHAYHDPESDAHFHACAPYNAWLLKIRYKGFLYWPTSWNLQPFRLNHSEAWQPC